jgi:tRNA (mo5U34)-methyltransferase
MGTDELWERATEIGWYHSIDLGNGFVTPGLSRTPPIPVAKFPTFQGRSVVDIGAWDGYYSFLAEREGASSVVALDHYVWCVDIPARDAYWRECEAQGVMPDHDRDMVDFWHPDTLPGRRGFEFAAAHLGSNVRPVVGDLLTVDLASLGTFDIALYLGVLYHMREPLTALTRLRQICREVAVIESEALHIPELEDESLCEFYPGGELNVDYGNWYAPSSPALVGMCRAAGFRKVEVVVGQPAAAPAPHPLRRLVPGLRAKYAKAIAERRRPLRYRIVVHAFP